jgi:pimeloyl-ACP methyl ester carboxylesterase
MHLTGKSRRLLLFLTLYLTFSAVAGIYVADGALHPSRRSLTEEDEFGMRQIAHSLDSDLENVSLITPDAATLRAWSIQPRRGNGDAAILLHGLADNRIGMIGYAQLLLARGFTVLLPDARAHGASGGQFATYGLLERNDIHQWFDILVARVHPHCIFGFGESMGAAQLLQSLAAEPRFCAVAAESSFSNFREIAYDRMGQPFHLGPWFGRSALRPVVEFAFLYTRWKYHFDMRQVSPENAVTATKVPVFLIHGHIDSNISPRHSRRIQARNPNTVLWEVPNADHCGAISAAPKEFEQRLLAWFSTPHVETAASPFPREAKQSALATAAIDCRSRPKSVATKRPCAPGTGPFYFSLRSQPTQPPSPKTRPDRPQTPSCTPPNRTNISFPQTAFQIRLSYRRASFHKPDPVSSSLLVKSIPSTGLQKRFRSQLCSK